MKWGRIWNCSSTNSKRMRPKKKNINKNFRKTISFMKHSRRLKWICSSWVYRIIIRSRGSLRDRSFKVWILMLRLSFKLQIFSLIMFTRNKNWENCILRKVKRNCLRVFIVRSVVKLMVVRIQVITARQITHKNCHQTYNSTNRMNE